MTPSADADAARRQRAGVAVREHRRAVGDAAPRRARPCAGRPRSARRGCAIASRLDASPRRASTRSSAQRRFTAVGRVARELVGRRRARRRRAARPAPAPYAAAMPISGAPRTASRADRVRHVAIVARLDVAHLARAAASGRGCADDARRATRWARTWGRGSLGNKKLLRLVVEKPAFSLISLAACESDLAPVFTGCRASSGRSLHHSR